MITVLKPGLLASVQDLGREGQRQLGVGPGGVLDGLALRLANRLVGNADGAAGLELTLGQCSLRFDAPTRVALMGDDFDARLDDQPLTPGWSTPVRAGQCLHLGAANRPGGKPGIRSWLALAGGIDVAPVLGSRSTDLKAAFGGHQGRALRKGDVLPLGASPLSEAQRSQRAFGLRGPDGWFEPGWTPSRADLLTTVLRVMPGPEWDDFQPPSQRQFQEASWRLMPQSNRMGSRLEGPALARHGAGDMLSSSVIVGTVQVPPSGQPIVLMGDAQTMGGYPRIAVVIRADHWRLARAPLGGVLRFVCVDAAAALTAWRHQQRELALLNQGLAVLGWPVQSMLPGTAATVPAESEACASI